MAEDSGVGDFVERHEIVKVIDVDLVKLLPQLLLIIFDQKPVVRVLPNRLDYAENCFDVVSFVEKNFQDPVYYSIV